jgi:hypothetical protein
VSSTVEETEGLDSAPICGCQRFDSDQRRRAFAQGRLRGVHTTYLSLALSTNEDWPGSAASTFNTSMDRVGAICLDRSSIPGPDTERGLP